MATTAPARPILKRTWAADKTILTEYSGEVKDSLKEKPRRPGEPDGGGG